MLKEVLCLFLLLACGFVCFICFFAGFLIRGIIITPKKEKAVVLSAEDEIAKKKMEKELKNFYEYTGDQQ